MPHLLEAQLRHARHYLNVLRAASKRYKQAGQEVDEALILFDAEWPSIQRGQAVVEELSKQKPRDR